DKGEGFCWGRMVEGSGKMGEWWSGAGNTESGVVESGGKKGV
nr:hypothetical protein [Tanacetum cinerariifolium]